MIIWQCSLWGKQRNRVKLLRGKLAQDEDAQFARCRKPTCDAMTMTMAMAMASQSNSLTYMRLFLIGLLLCTPVSSKSPVEDEVPHFVGRNGRFIANPEARAMPVNVTEKGVDVCEIPANTRVAVVVSTCCDGKVTLNISNATRHYRSGERFLMVQPGRKRQFRMSGTLSCAAFALCNTALQADPLPENTVVSVYMELPILHIMWKPSQMEMTGLVDYEVLVSTSKSLISDGCNVARGAHKLRRSAEKCQQLDEGTISAGQQDQVWLCQVKCGSHSSCKSEINLARFSLTEGTVYYVNLVIVFYGMRMSYKATEFCYSDSNENCAALTPITSTQQPLTTTREISVSAETIELHDQASPSSPEIVMQFTELKMTKTRQTSYGVEYSTSLLLQAPPDAGFFVALYFYMCSNRRATVRVIGNDTLVGHASLGNYSLRFASLISDSALQNTNLQIKYAAGRLAASEQPRLRLNALFYKNASRDMLPPLASRTQLQIDARRINDRRCLLNISFSLACIRKSAVCSAENRHSVYYRLVRRSPAQVRSCLGTNGVTGKPYDKDALKNVTITRLAHKRGVQGVRPARVRPARPWTYQMLLEVAVARDLARQYFVQLYWNEGSSDAFIPFTEAAFRIMPNCSLTVRPERQSLSQVHVRSRMRGAAR